MSGKFIICGNYKKTTGEKLDKRIRSKSLGISLQLLMTNLIQVNHAISLSLNGIKRGNLTNNLTNIHSFSEKKGKKKSNNTFRIFQIEIIVKVRATTLKTRMITTGTPKTNRSALPLEIQQNTSASRVEKKKENVSFKLWICSGANLCGC